MLEPHCKEHYLLLPLRRRPCYKVLILILSFLLLTYAQVNAQRRTFGPGMKVVNTDSLVTVVTKYGLKTKTGLRGFTHLVQANQYVANRVEFDSLRLLLKLGKELNDTFALSTASALLSKNLYIIKQRDSANYYAEQVIALSKGKPSHNLARAYTTKANLEYDWGNVTEALDYAVKAKDILEANNDLFHVANAYNMIGILYGYRGLKNEVISYYKRALRIYKNLDYIQGELRMYNNMADLYIRSKQYDSAKYLLDQALQIQKKLGPQNRHYGYSVLITYGELLLKLNKPAEALTLLKQGRAVVREAKQFSAELEIIYLMGECYGALGNLIKGRSLLDSALTTAKRDSMKLVVPIIMYKKAEWHEKFGSKDSAIFLLKLFNDLTEANRTANSIRTNEEFNQKYQLQDKDKTIALAEQEKKFLTLQLQQAEQLQILWIALLTLASIGLASGAYVVYTIRKQNNLLTKKNEQIEEAQGALQQANDTKDKLFALVAHDLRGPIGGLKNLPILIRAYQGGERVTDETLEHLADAIEKSVFPVYELMEALLIWAQANQNELSVELEQQSPTPTIEKVIEIYQPIADRKKISLQFENYIPKESLAVFDENSLFTILRNLVGNAIKFSPVETGLVTITLLQKEPHKIEISVQDNGTGIPAEILKHFNKPSRKNTRLGTAGEKGSGMGLLLVKELVALNKMSFNIDSQEGIGTKVSIEMVSV